MAAKRFSDDSGNIPADFHNQQKAAKTSKLSLSSGIKDAIKQKFTHLSSTLQPMIRQVVREEVEDAIRRNLSSLTSATSQQIQAAIDEPPSFQLVFGQKLSLPIFTSTKILDSDNRQLQILLLDARTSLPTSLPYPIKIEIVVLHGDFPQGGDLERWNSREFDMNVVRERDGMRPLLAGELFVTMRDAWCSAAEIEFTDNSSWTRSRRFRLGARVVQGSCSSGAGGGDGLRIRPAMTEEAFVVKHHRGESYKKHYPPTLHDEVWRLEKIGKDGAFHRKLSEEGIENVQDFLKLSVVDPQRLKKIMGIGISEKIWNATLNHAWTCEMGTKMYIHRGPNFEIVLNPVCQVIKAMISGKVYASCDSNVTLKKLVKEAYARWSTLEEVDGQKNETALLNMGDQYVSHLLPIQQAMAIHPNSNNTNEQVEYNNDEWDINCNYFIGRYFPECPDQNDLP